MTQTLDAYLPAKVTRSADFVAQGFRDEVLASGLYARWNRWVQCACSNIHRLANVMPDESAILGDVRVDCFKCKGRRGYVYASQVIPLQVTNASHTDEVASIAGGFASASIRITTFQEHTIRLWDRIVLLGARHPLSGDVEPANKLVVSYVEKKVHKATVESLRFPVERTRFNLGQPGDQTTLDQTTYGVDYCIAAGLDGIVIDQQLVEGTDFEITPTGQIDWTLGEGLGTAPVLGARYVIRYLCHPSYVVKSLPFAHRAQTRVYKGELQLARLNFCADAWAEWLGEDTQP